MVGELTLDKLYVELSADGSRAVERRVLGLAVRRRHRRLARGAGGRRLDDGRRRHLRHG